jgi:signal transduction histidine kinase
MGFGLSPGETAGMLAAHNGVTDDLPHHSRFPNAARAAALRARRLVLVTAILAATTWLAGFAIERLRLGNDDSEAAAKVAIEVRGDFSGMARSLQRVADYLTARVPASPVASTDSRILRQLFDDAASAVGITQEDGIAVTVFTLDGVPLAWAGRPSELPISRTSGPAALFVAPGLLGPRLVLVRPLTGGAGAKPTRLATIVVERVLPLVSDVRDKTAGTFVLKTQVAPVVLRTRYEGAGEGHDSAGFVIDGLDGVPLLEGFVRRSDVGATRAALRRIVIGLLLTVIALACALLPTLFGEWRARTRRTRSYLLSILLSVLSVCASRSLLWIAVPPSLMGPPVIQRTAANGGWLALILRSPLDFLLTSLAALGLVMIAASAVDRARIARRPARGGILASGPLGVAGLIGSAVTSGVMLAAYQFFLSATMSGASTDLLRFSLHPWSSARLEMAAGLVLGHAAVVWGCVVVLRLTTAAVRVSGRATDRIGLAVVWGVPILAGSAWIGSTSWPVPAVGIWLPGLVAIALGWMAPHIGRRYRHSSQAGRLMALFVALTLPALAVYPSLFVHAERSKHQLIETRLAPQATSQRDELKRNVRRALAEIDALSGLSDVVAASPPAGSGPVPTDAAFRVWTQTDLASLRLTSAIELYGSNGSLVSRFALNLPEYASTQQKWQEPVCQWDLFEEVSPFGSEERRLLHAGRGICAKDPAGRGKPVMVGAIVVHSMLDYGTLPFITSQNPYVELLRGNRDLISEGMSGRDVEFVVYGWSRRPVYMSGTRAWEFDEGTFDRVYASRQPFWTELDQAGRPFHVFVSNDRGGIYALGYPAVPPIGHLVNVAELGTLSASVYVVLLLAVIAGGVVSGRQSSRGRDLLREIRASFYRKLFLAFVAAAVIPVITLAFVARAYMTARLRADIEDAATRTTAVAQRVVEETGRLQERDSGPLTLDDDVLVWLGRAIDQDVNVFDGPHLIATSERDLFASGLLPTRTSADVYRAIAIDRRAGLVGEERAGQSTYMLAAAPVRAGGREAILTVPLTLRQQAIEREIDDLTRRILLAVVAFILAGSGLGYWMAERIADPVNRLRRATTRIARGDLDARVALTSSDELRRLVEAFNRMASELQRQQGQLERTHRLEAWADMARQVAHEIKNPLTPIQLSAEHLRRVNVDRGSPLSPVLEDCINSILSQVRLLRQIAGEFSSFASSPTPRPVATPPAELVNEVVDAYRTGVADRIRLIVDVPADLPPIWVDRALIGRALTNLIDNALHAMPSRGELAITARVAASRQALEIDVRDTGAGMDAEALRRVFEPYFSTKAVGTGLGLTIAKRNIELHAGSISVESTPGHGTTVRLVIPVGAPPAHPESRS